MIQTLTTGLYSSYTDYSKSSFNFVVLNVAKHKCLSHGPQKLVHGWKDVQKICNSQKLSSKIPKCPFTSSDRSPSTSMESTVGQNLLSQRNSTLSENWVC